jgi:hypothetical protein
LTPPALLRRDEVEQLEQREALPSPLHDREPPFRYLYRCFSGAGFLTTP